MLQVQVLHEAPLVRCGVTVHNRVWPTVKKRKEKFKSLFENTIKKKAIRYKQTGLFLALRVRRHSKLCARTITSVLLSVTPQGDI